jgi:hypothetical protein
LPHSKRNDKRRAQDCYKEQKKGCFRIHTAMVAKKSV